MSRYAKLTKPVADQWVAAFRRAEKSLEWNHSLASRVLGAQRDLGLKLLNPSGSSAPAKRPAAKKAAAAAS